MSRDSRYYAGQNDQNEYENVNDRNDTIRDDCDPYLACRDQNCHCHGDVKDDSHPNREEHDSLDRSGPRFDRPRSRDRSTRQVDTNRYREKDSPDKPYDKQVDQYSGQTVRHKNDSSDIDTDKIDD